MIDEPAAEDGTNRGGNGAEAGPGADRAPAFFFSKGAADNGEAARNEKRGSKSLSGARNNQLANRAGASAPG